MSDRTSARRRGAIHLLLCLALLALSRGCVNLEEVRQYAKASVATADYKQVVSDYAQSPLRHIRYAGPNATDDLKRQAAACAGREFGKTKE